MNNYNNHHFVVLRVIVNFEPTLFRSWRTEEDAAEEEFGNDNAGTQFLNDVAANRFILSAVIRIMKRNLS